MDQGKQTSRGTSLLRSTPLGVMLCLCLMLVSTAAAPAQQRRELQDGQWVEQTPPPPGSPQAQLDAIRKLIAEGKGKEAKHAADDWIEANAGHELMPEALLTRGDANVAREHFFKSLFDYERVIREYPGSEQFETAMLREFELAKLFMAGAKRRLWGMRILPATAEAEEILVRIQERSPGSALGEVASLTLADYYFDKPQMDSAADVYDLFLINYPRSERREWAMLRLIQANLARFKGPRFDATGLIDAGQRLKSYKAAYPASAERLGVDALLIRIDESLAMRDMVAADWHVQRKQPLSAIHLYQRVIQDYPQTAAAQDAVRELESLGAKPLPIDPQHTQNIDVESIPAPPESTPDSLPQLETEPPVTPDLTPSPTDVAESQPYELEDQPVEPVSTEQPAVLEEPEPVSDTEAPIEEITDTATEAQPTPEKP